MMKWGSGLKHSPNKRWSLGSLRAMKGLIYVTNIGVDRYESLKGYVGGIERMGRFWKDPNLY